MIYKIQNDETIMAANAAEFVTKLREGSKMDWDCTDAEYMVNFAKRRKISTGDDVRTDTVESFVQSLINDGFIREII